MVHVIVTSETYDEFSVFEVNRPRYTWVNFPNTTPWWQRPPFVLSVPSRGMYTKTCRQVAVGQSEFYATDFDGITPKMIEAAIDEGLDPNLEQDSGGGRNLLQMVISIRRLDLAEMLVQMGAHITGGLCSFYLFLGPPRLQAHISPLTDPAMYLKIVKILGEQCDCDSVAGNHLYDFLEHDELGSALFAFNASPWAAVSSMFPRRKISKRLRLDRAKGFEELIRALRVELEKTEKRAAAVAVKEARLLRRYGGSETSWFKNSEIIAVHCARKRMRCVEMFLSRREASLSLRRKGIPFGCIHVIVGWAFPATYACT